MWTRWVRMAVVVAFAWKTGVRAPAARSRLWDTAHRISHAAFALNFPDGRWAGLAVGDDLLDHRMVAVLALGLQRGEGGCR
ncbi:hypothetical protein ACFW9V_38790 [Streptomyces hygroscopicus]|uniref:hypothetical protein n=2 Tax=Streptomyces TaxID=1883 RepID=UPI003683709E